MPRQLIPKPLFDSSTVRGATASAVATIIIGILPFVQSIGHRHCRGNQICESDVSDVVEIISVVVTTVGLGSASFAVVGRASIGDLWTPKGVPGPNREDFEREPDLGINTSDSQDKRSFNGHSSTVEFANDREAIVRQTATLVNPVDDPMEGIE